MPPTEWTNFSYTQELESLTVSAMKFKSMYSKSAAQMAKEAMAAADMEASACKKVRKTIVEETSRKVVAAWVGILNLKANTHYPLLNWGRTYFCVGPASLNRGHNFTEWKPASLTWGQPCIFHSGSTLMHDKKKLWAEVSRVNCYDKKIPDTKYKNLFCIYFFGIFKLERIDALIDDLKLAKTIYKNKGFKPIFWLVFSRTFFYLWRKC